MAIGGILPPASGDDHSQHRQSYHQDALCERALQFIRANVTRPIRAEDVARDLAISTRHLNRIFRSAFSETVTQAVMREKLIAAREMLRNDPRLLVKQVSAALAFHSPSYFSYSFRRFYGYSPIDAGRH